MISCLPLSHSQLVPWLGIELADFRFTGRCPTHWATVRACHWVFMAMCSSVGSIPRTGLVDLKWEAEITWTEAEGGGRQWDRTDWKESQLQQFWSRRIWVKWKVIDINGKGKVSRGLSSLLISMTAMFERVKEEQTNPEMWGWRTSLSPALPGLPKSLWESGFSQGQRSPVFSVPWGSEEDLLLLWIKDFPLAWLPWVCSRQS